MAMNVYVFNPDNDLALANGGEHYTPTPMAELFRRDLQLLPCWIASPGDCVLCDSSHWQSWAESHGLSVNIITYNDLPHLDDNTLICPWGWSPAMRRRLLRHGVKESLLPTAEQTNQWRELSHRRTSIALHNAIARHAGKQFCQAPVELSDIDAIVEFANAHPGCFAKEPWSGSGHGVYRAIDPNGRDFRQRCLGALKRQGSMMCEIPFDRVMDFAIEMKCEKGKTRITGYSIFQSDFHLQYKRGIVDASQSLRNRIASQFADFQIVEHATVKAIDEVAAKHYDGHIGVDMLLHSNPDGSIGINPCVELNLRTTMGAVTASLGQRHGMKGYFAIVPVTSITEHDITLTPITHETKMAAIITQENEKQ